MQWTLLQDLGFTSSIAPCHYSKGQCHYPGFPQWLGKNATANKAKRLINELKKTMGHRIQCDTSTLLNEYLPLIFDEIYKHMKNDNINEAIEVMDKLNISNEQFKEHVITLLMDKKRVDKLNKISTKSKTAFTKAYNAIHKTSLKAKKKKKEGGEGIEKDQFDPDREEEEEFINDSEESDYEIEAIKPKGKAAKKGKSKKAKASKGKSKK